MNDSNLKIKKYDIALTSLYDLRHVERDYHCFTRLLSKGYQVVVFTNGYDIFRYFYEKNIDIINLSEEIKKVEICLPIENEVERIKKKYHISYSFYRFIETNYLQNRTLFCKRSDAIFYAVRLFNAYENLFHRISVDTFFQLHTADIDRMVPRYVCKLYCKHVFEYTASGFPGKDFILIENEDFKVKGFRQNLNKIETVDSKIISEIRNNMLTLKKKNKYLPPPKFSIMNKLKKFPYIKERLNKSSKTQFIKNNLTQIIIHPIRKLINKRLYHLPSQTDRYIFYPIHAPIEDQVIVRGFPYRNEFELIKTIALSLPYGYKLYVKEHPGYEGFYPVQNFKELLQFEQVKIIPPNLNSHEIIKNSKLCIVINSTVWFEALLLNIPVIALGKGFFSGFGVCKEVEDINQLDEAILNTLSFTPNRATINKFLYALYSLSYKHEFRYYLSQTPQIAGIELSGLIEKIIANNAYRQHISEE